MSEQPSRISRREFTALSIAAGVVAAADVAVVSGAKAAAGAAALPLAETDVRVQTLDGSCAAALIHPRQGSWPGVILFTDVFGLRPGTREMARRLAAGGFSVLVPNPFYRTAEPPGLALDMDFNKPADRARMDALRAPLTSAAVMRDAAAYVRFLDAQPAVDAVAKLAAFGYCMGGPMTLRAAAAVPDRIGAGASFHGRGLVTEVPDSPHRLVPMLRARFYIGIATNDHERQPDAKSTLEDAFEAAHLQAKIEVYEGCSHGWCVSDMPASPGKPPVYNGTQAERAWSEMLSLFKRVHG